MSHARGGEVGSSDAYSDDGAPSASSGVVSWRGRGAGAGGDGAYSDGGGSARSDLSLLGALNGVCASVEDVLNELSENYTFEVRPELRLKLRKRTPWVTVGVTYEAQSARTEFVAKRGRSDLPLWKLIRRVVATPERNNVHVHSTKLSLGMLALEGVYTLDTATHVSAFSWRVGSSWDVGLTHVGRKQPLPSPLPSLLKASARWDVATIKAPDLNGQLGGGGDGGVAVDLGKFHLSLPRLQLTAEL